LFCESAALRAGDSSHSLEKAIRWWIRGHFPSSLREAFLHWLPYRPWINLLRYKSTAPEPPFDRGGVSGDFAAIVVKKEVTLDVRKLQNRHKWFGRCDRMWRGDAFDQVSMGWRAFIRRRWDGSGKQENIRTKKRHGQTMKFAHALNWSGFSRRLTLQEREYTLGA